jgi:glycosyltransferase involved in cell wall biosynthesis
VKVWVFVPCYNRPDLLRRCVESIAEQDDPDFEIVITDDASTDPEVNQVLGRFVRHGIRVLTRDENVGATRNIVEAIRTVQTSADMPADDVILLVDGDDRLAHPRVISRLRETFAGGVIEAAYGSYEPDPPDDGCPPALPIPNDILKWGMIRAFTRDHGPFYNHPLAFRRRMFDVLRPDDFLGPDGEWLKYGYDTTLMIPILEAAGWRVQFVAETLYVYTSDRDDSVYLAHTEANQAENDWVTSQPRKYQPLEIEP